MVSCGSAWSWQCDVAHCWLGSQVSMYKIRRTPPPLSVTLPPPSSTTSALVFTTLAVACMLMVTGAGPQEKVMMPPAATAATTAADVQLAGVPLPITCVGCDVLTGRAATGRQARPDGLPGAGSAGAGTGWVAAGAGDGVGRGLGRAGGVGRTLCRGWIAAAGLTFPDAVPQAVTASADARAASNTPKPPVTRMAPHVSDCLTGSGLVRAWSAAAEIPGTRPGHPARSGHATCKRAGHREGGPHDHIDRKSTR